MSSKTLDFALLLYLFI